MTDEELAEIQKMVVQAAQEIESRLATSLDKAIEGLTTRVDGTAAAAVELQTKAKAAFETLPNLIQEQVESHLSDNLTGIVDQLGKQFEGKLAQARGNSEGGGGGLSMENLLAHADKVVAVVNAFRSPTTEQAMMGQMNFVMKWHSLLSKLEKGGGSSDEFTKTIASTFTTEKQE